MVIGDDAHWTLFSVATLGHPKIWVGLEISCEEFGDRTDAMEGFVMGRDAREELGRYIGTNSLSGLVAAIVLIGCCSIRDNSLGWAVVDKCI